MLGPMHPGNVNGDHWPGPLMCTMDPWRSRWLFVHDFEGDRPFSNEFFQKNEAINVSDCVVRRQLQDLHIEMAEPDTIQF